MQTLLLPALAISQAAGLVDLDDLGNFTSLLQVSRQWRKPATWTSEWKPDAKVCDDVVPLRESIKPMPSVGYISCCDPLTDQQPSVVLEAATQFLRRGGRLLYTAQMYGTEGATGAAIQQSGVSRAEVFVLSKLHPSKVPSTGVREWVARMVQKSLQTMNLSYLDAMLIHFGPTASRIANVFVRNLTPKQDLELYKGLIDAQMEGKVRNIGVCLHTRDEIEFLAQSTGLLPAIAAFWYSPFMPEVTHDYKNWLQSQGIAVLAYGMLNWKVSEMPHSAEYMHETTKIAARSNATFGQVMIRWALDENIAMITSMSDPTDLNEDLHCLQSALPQQDHTSLASLPRWTCEEIEPIQALMGCYP